MNIGKPFKIFSWHRDFLGPLARFVLENGDPARTVLVFPHTRPAHFLYREIAALTPGPAVMPRCYSLREFSDQLLTELPDIPLKQASELDCIALLHQAVQAAFAVKNKAARKLNFPLDSLELFIPWGRRLAALMEDFFTARLLPANLNYLEGQLEPFAALLLSGIADIYHHYLELLQQNGLCTPAQNGASLAAYCQQAKQGSAPSFRFCQGKKLIFAGFHLLSGIEDPVLRYLWEQEGAEICLHSDPRLSTNPEAVHWAAREHRNWLKKWKAECQAVQPAETTTQPHCKLKIYEGFDLHSQIHELRNQIDHLQQEDGAAVILPDAQLLLPVLHGLSGKTINISMGYPLRRTPLADLLESLLQLQEKAVPNNPAADTDPVLNRGLRYHWQDLLRLLHQPYIRMLGESKNLPIRALLSSLETKILEGERYISLPELLACAEQIIFSSLPAEDQLFLTPEAEQADNACALTDCLALIQRAFQLLIGNWEEVCALPDLCAHLLELCEFLAKEGDTLWERFPLDGEYLFRVKHSTIPMLRDNLIAAHNGTMGKTTMFSLLRACLEAERVPFEAYPLEGLQILGMLESRMLAFKHLYILDANEDVLPGLNADDPLLPDHLRRETGLPALAEREKMVAHTFYRLLFSSGEATIFYQTGGAKVGLLDDRKNRSRFIEELLWEAEKNRGALLKPGEAPLFAIKPRLSSPCPERREIVRTPIIDQAVRAWAASGISPSRLDIYLQCPLLFFHEVIACLEPYDQKPEGDDPAAVGTLIHKVLEEFFRPYLGRKLKAGLDAEAGTRLRELFSEKLAQSGLAETLPYDSLFMLREAGPSRLEEYLNNIPDTEIISLEKSFNEPFGVGKRQYVLRGQVDRTDRRNGEVIVLDYKTGKVSNPAAEFWHSDNPLWRRMQFWNAGKNDDPTLLSDLHKELPSLQLPVYLLVFSRDLGIRASDAAFIPLSGSRSERGKEKNLLAKQEDSEKQLIITERIPALLGFVLTHLESSRKFVAQPGEHCRYCLWSSVCGEK